MDNNTQDEVDRIIADLSKLDFRSLNAIKKQFDKILDKAEAKVLSEARERANDAVRALGLNSVDDLVAGKKEKTRKKTYKYVLDNNEWYGRGRTPSWVQDYLRIDGSYDRTDPDQLSKMEAIKVLLTNSSD